jgi:DNA-binding CsgD family transcriptional regulator
MGGNCKGTSVYLLDQRSVLIEVASFGRTHDFGLEVISAWDDTLLSNAVRTRKLATEQTEESTIYALPIQHDEVATGVFVFNMSRDLSLFTLPEEVTSMLSSLGGLYMHNKGFGLGAQINSSGSQNSNDSVEIQELTTRQVKIIDLIAQGLTNAEIAKQVLLSESTVRQETIRIFRILKCHSRSEAVVIARANGIIEAVSAAS